MTIPLHNEIDPSPADIALRLCELNNEEYVIAPFEPIYTSDDEDVGFRIELAHIMHFICAETDFEEYDGEESGTESLDCRLSMMHDAVRDWLFKNISYLLAFAAAMNTIRVEPLSSGSYKITLISKNSASKVDQYTSRNLAPAERKKRKMLLAALAALRHERSAEIAYLKNDIAAFAVHLSYMWRSYARLATYPALHDGRALAEARPKHSGRPKEDRKPLRKLLEKFCPNYLNEKNIEIWRKLRKGLESTDGKITFGKTTFSIYFESTTAALETGGYIREKRLGKEEKRRSYEWLRGMLSSWRKNAII
ncbi:hypothetical protein [Humidesulfovibrio sp.]